MLRNQEYVRIEFPINERLEILCQYMTHDTIQICLCSLSLYAICMLTNHEYVRIEFLLWGREYVLIPHAVGKEGVAREIEKRQVLGRVYQRRQICCRVVWDAVFRQRQPLDWLHAMFCCVLHCVAICCSVLQGCNMLQCCSVAVSGAKCAAERSEMQPWDTDGHEFGCTQCVAVRCSMIQCVAVCLAVAPNLLLTTHCNTLQRNTMQRTAMHCMQLIQWL